MTRTTRTTRATAEPVAQLVRQEAHLLEGAAGDYDPLLERIGDARVVCLGEATHGTHEFYRARTEITRRLVEERGFAAVAVEADWPDAHRVDRFVRGASADPGPREALGDFQRFPLWMWRNEEVVELVGWLRERNAGRPEREHVGFYGLDLYSLYASIESVLGYLDGVDPEAARRARTRYACLDHTGGDPQHYGWGTSLGLRPDCRREAIDQLVELRRKSLEYLSRDGVTAADAHFYAEQNARLIRNAEEYYREMFGRRVNTWNLRDRHMASTLDALLAHLSHTRGRPARVVVWEHNSHLGDARATERATRDELNVGQLVRERYGDQAVLVGFTTHEGAVAAARDWGQPVERRRVRPSLEGSFERLFHETGLERFLLVLEPGDLAMALAEPRLERAIGVIYRPETERWSHYFHASLARQFDAVVHFDATRAVGPLDQGPEWEPGEEPPETYPTGL